MGGGWGSRLRAVRRAVLGGVITAPIVSTVPVFPASSSSEESLPELEADFIWTDSAELDAADSLSSPELEFYTN